MGKIKRIMYGNMRAKTANNKPIGEVIQMLVTFLRTMILYLVVVFGIRLMGKRQVAEMQATEFVITILIAAL